jgi:hypothetical protein
VLEQVKEEAFDTREEISKADAAGWLTKSRQLSKVWLQQSVIAQAT